MKKVLALPKKSYRVTEGYRHYEPYIYIYGQASEWQSYEAVMTLKGFSKKYPEEWRKVNADMKNKTAKGEYKVTMGEL